MHIFARSIIIHHLRTSKCSFHITSWRFSRGVCSYKTQEVNLHCRTGCTKFCENRSAGSKVEIVRVGVTQHGDLVSLLFSSFLGEKNMLKQELEKGNLNEIQCGLKGRFLYTVEYDVPIHAFKASFSCDRSNK